MVVTGRSGAGKTTLLNIIAGLARPTSGSVTVDDVDLWNISDRRLSRLRNRTMGFVFQFPSLLASLSVLQNVVLPLSFADGADHDGRARAVELLDHGRTGGQADEPTPASFRPASSSGW